MRVLVRDWPEKDPDCEVRLVAASGETAGGCERLENGMFDFTGVDERAAYSLWISPLTDGRTLYLSGLRPGPNRVAVSLEKGGVIRGVLVRRVRVEEVEIRLEGPGFTLNSVQFPDGRFQITGVPSGTFTVVAEGRLDGTAIRASVRAGRGESVELVLGEERDD